MVPGRGHGKLKKQKASHGPCQDDDDLGRVKVNKSAVRTRRRKASITNARLPAKRPIHRTCYCVITPPLRKRSAVSPQTGIDRIGGKQMPRLTRKLTPRMHHPAAKIGPAFFTGRYFARSSSSPSQREYDDPTKNAAYRRTPKTMPQAPAASRRFRHATGNGNGAVCRLRPPGTSNSCQRSAGRRSIMISNAATKAANTACANKSMETVQTCRINNATFGPISGKHASIHVAVLCTICSTEKRFLCVDGRRLLRARKPGAK